MSYSRWSASIWYTFWAFSGDTSFKLPTKKLKNSQVFEICDFPSYCVTYGELMNNGLFDTLDDIKKFYSKDHLYDVNSNSVYKAKNPTNEEMDELCMYLIRFIEDVDDHFKWFNFFKYEWYYPLRNKIKW
jgi:hypothetical protein